MSLFQLKLIAKTKAAKEFEKQQQLSSEDLSSLKELNRRSVNAAELNFALQTGSLRKKSVKHAWETASVASDVVPEAGVTAGGNKSAERTPGTQDLSLEEKTTTGK